VSIESWTTTGIRGLRAEADLAARIHNRDASAWGPGEDDPADRLGWLDLPTRMRAEAGALARFASSVAGDGIERVVLLGMGGSSLAPEVWAETFGPAPGHPDLTVLDSTHPMVVRSVTESLDPQRTLWIVSSKSGGTVETMSLYKHFRRMRDDGSAFVAITDPKTSLETLAAEEGFRATWLNPPDIGGRYSALSFFGLVPAALLGVDVPRLLDRAQGMAQACGPDVDPKANSALQIGTAVARLAQGGRDKLTWIVSEPIAGFGDWVEQLIAESTGKQGTGIAPIVDEPEGPATSYGFDRAFVRLRLAGDATHDTHLDDLRRAGHPVIDITIDETYDVAAEMWRWEFATAVAGSILGINAFDQPDVEAAKKAARKAAESSEEIGWPDEDPSVLFRDVAPPELCALLLFVPPDDSARSALRAARAKLLSTRGVATSAGFGPRYLHSTGQLHKGGPRRLRALVVLDEPGEDVEIPGSDFGFARLITAQAYGDAQALADAGRTVIKTTRSSFERWAQS
jgi:transaldolase / glucose-6-phosphate isomerase